MKKDWKNLSDKELDKEFKRAANHQTIPFKPGDWDLMAEKLDGTALWFSFHQVWIWGLLLGLMVLVGLHLRGREQFVQNDKVGAYSAEPLSKNSIYLFQDKDEIEVKNLAVNSPKIVQSASRAYSEPLQIIAKPPIELMEMDTKHLTEIIRLSEQSNGLEESMEVEAPITNPSSSRFSFTLMASPDISAFKVNEINGVGSNAGFFLEYFLNSKLSVVSGAKYGNKIYRTSINEGYGGYYPSIASFWDGECKVLDIPLNIRYYAIDRAKERWYFSSGISSYFMLREQYALITEYGGKMETQQIDIRNQNRHLFGIINIGIGYERQLYDKWSLQIEPYVKLPMAGVGESDINLKSTGIWVGLKHRW